MRPATLAAWPRLKFVAVFAPLHSPSMPATVGGVYVEEWMDSHSRAAIQLPVGLPAALNTPQAAIYTGLAEKTLEGLRCRGGGPRFVRYGRKAVRYLIRDLDEWMSARVVGSTSEAIAA